MLYFYTDCNLIICLCLQVKTHLQSLSDQKIAVGHQHAHTGMKHGLTVIYNEHGVKGLWRGVTGAMARVMVGSAAQLSTFSSCRQYIVKTQVRYHFVF